MGIKNVAAGLANLNRFFFGHPLSRSPLAPWARFLRWQIHSRIQREVIFSWIHGTKLAVRRGMMGATGNIYVGLHEFSDMMVTLHFLRRGDLFLDIGANVGTYSILGSGVAKAQTWAFEPDPNTARDLERNLALNGLEQRVTIYKCALGPSQGDVYFTDGLSTTNMVASSGSRKVRQETLDFIVGNAEPIMAKIDVEGYEEELFRGAMSTLAKPSLRVIVIETITPAIKQALSSCGFERAYYDAFTRNLSRDPVGEKGNNSLYVKDWSFVAKRLREGNPVSVGGRTI